MADNLQTLQQLEQRAERAIVQELRLMVQELLQLRPHLDEQERCFADGLLMKMERLAQDQSTGPAMATAGVALIAPAQTLPGDPREDEAPPYQVAFHGPGSGRTDRIGMALLPGFEAAVQAVIDHLPAHTDFLVEAQWIEGRGSMHVTTLGGKPLASIEPATRTQVRVHPSVALACQALRRGDAAGIDALFGQALMAA